MGTSTKFKREENFEKQIGELRKVKEGEKKIKNKKGGRSGTREEREVGVDLYQSKRKMKWALALT